MRISIKSLTLFAAILAVSGGAYAAPLSPSEVLYSADQYNGQAIKVEGIVTKLQANTGNDGKPYQTFQLCDAGACLSVYAAGKTVYTEGADVKVKGRFWMTKMVGYHTYHNELDSED